MSNTELSKYYLQMQPLQGQLPSCTYANIIQTIDTYCKGKWSWEVTNESFAMDNTVVCTTVTLYIPGKVLTGRSVSPCKEYAQNHLKALLNACQTIVVSETPQQDAQTPSQPQGNMTPSEIMGMINGSSTAPKTPPTPKAKGDDDLPFYFGSEQKPQKNNSNLFDGVVDTPNTSPQKPQSNTTPQYPPDYDVPKPHLNGFTQRQVDGVNAFKVKLDVVNDAMFNNYIHVWNSNLTNKSQLTPDNIDDFLNWVSTLGEMDR